ncbi:MAG: HpcH/HpaI aldolase/citrate lyase family protein [Beijerinckiaceae bacterium]
MTSRLLRSALYIPATNQKALAKAGSLGADAVIVDLEDSVAPDAKATARGGLQQLNALSGTLQIIRVNAAGSEWHEADIAACANLPVNALLLPKVNSADDILALRQRMANHGLNSSITIWAMIETPRGVLNAAAIAEALGSDGVMVMGLNDLSKETGMAQTAGRLPMVHALSACVLAARAYGLAIVDGVFNALDDAEGYETECRQGRDFGFDGKTLIHPKQIAPANAAFGPSADQIAEATTIVTAFDAPQNTGKGVIALNGKMVERLHLEMARTVLARAAAIETKGH